MGTGVIFSCDCKKVFSVVIAWKDWPCPMFKKILKRFLFSFENFVLESWLIIKLPFFFRIIQRFIFFYFVFFVKGFGSDFYVSLNFIFLLSLSVIFPFVWNTKRDFIAQNNLFFKFIGCVFNVSENVFQN